MYSMLLVATPFILLQNFLQQAIGELSASKVPIGKTSIPIVPLVALALVLVMGWRFRRHLTRLRILAGVAAILMIALAQQITDFYFGHSFYELQMNWHYIAYTIFAFMVYRDLYPRGTRLTKVMAVTFLLALLFSTFDEIVQMRISNRVFDVSDIAKDAWGAATGLVVLYLGRSGGPDFARDWSPIRHRQVSGYLRSPGSLLLLILVCGLLFLCIGSLLTDYPHWPLAAGLTIGAFLVFFVLFHASQSRWVGWPLLGLLITGLALMSVSYLRHRSEGVTESRYGMAVYKGIPIPFFDVMIYPSGSFRLVDKKHYFNKRDQEFLLRQGPDIILIGSGMEGKGGQGFPEPYTSQFLFNPYTGRGTQVIVLKNPDAREAFNRMRRDGKRVLFVLHNTC
jgi:hypothetical protein